MKSQNAREQGVQSLTLVALKMRCHRARGKYRVILELLDAVGARSGEKSVQKRRFELGTRIG